jgi:hypothetical protein
MTMNYTKIKGSDLTPAQMERAIEQIRPKYGHHHYEWFYRRTFYFCGFAKRFIGIFEETK